MSSKNFNNYNVAVWGMTPHSAKKIRKHYRRVWFPNPHITTLPTLPTLCFSQPTLLKLLTFKALLRDGMNITRKDAHSTENIRNGHPSHSTKVLITGILPIPQRIYATPHPKISITITLQFGV